MCEVAHAIDTHMLSYGSLCQRNWITNPSSELKGRAIPPVITGLGCPQQPNPQIHEVLGLDAPKRIIPYVINLMVCELLSIVESIILPYVWSRWSSKGGLQGRCPQDQGLLGLIGQACPIGRAGMGPGLIRTCMSNLARTLGRPPARHGEAAPGRSRLS